MQARRCRDVSFLMMFILMWAGMAYVGVMAINRGDIRRYNWAFTLSNHCFCIILDLCTDWIPMVVFVAPKLLISIFPQCQTSTTSIRSLPPAIEFVWIRALVFLELLYVDTMHRMWIWRHRWTITNLWPAIVHWPAHRLPVRFYDASFILAHHIINSISFLSMRSTSSGHIRSIHQFHHHFLQHDATHVCKCANISRLVICERGVQWCLSGVVDHFNVIWCELGFTWNP